MIDRSRITNLENQVAGGLQPTGSHLHIAASEEEAQEIFARKHAEEAHLNKLRKRFGLDELPEQNTLVIIRNPGDD